MTDPQTHLTRRNGKWQLIARNGAGAGDLSLGYCPSQYIAVRVWLACLAQGKR
ncbi:hypothetical protein [Actibacterium sp.]|uniref:hypothetical protein n=1 Tax=Actibacterium sp. TaxID=1872125 RepID=UPI00257B1CAE|nr:hypothetical protein [Actibacterium sp.]